MHKFGRAIVKSRILILILSVVLLLPAGFGILNTEINYDILSFLPQNINSTKAQKVIDENFESTGANILIVENIESKEVIKIKEKISKVDGVQDVLWIDEVIDSSFPKDMLPEDVKKVFYSEDSTALFISFEEVNASIRTNEAVEEIREISGDNCYLVGMAGMLKDTKDLSDKEKPFYVLLAVILSVIVLSLTLKSTLIPLIFLIGIGFAIAYNMGTNYFLGSVSYITNSLAAVLQLGVTMDFSIFLLHRYEEEKVKLGNKEEAMGEAIAKTLVSITGSSLTTIAGFLALCIMELTLGKDIGIVMAKGVMFGVLCTVTILPSLILTFDGIIHKYSHKTILPSFEGLGNFVCKKYKLFIVIFLLTFIPAIYGKENAGVFYNLIKTLPSDMKSIVATEKLKADYGMTTTHFILVDENLKNYKVQEMVSEIEKVDGIENVISSDKYIGPRVPTDFIPEEISKKVQGGGYKLILANSRYEAAQDEENEQIDELKKIVTRYDKGALIGGEGPLTKDLIEISDIDFKRVSFASIIAIFAIILIIFKSISIPILLVGAIQLAIFVNMGIPFYTGSTIPFISSIVIGCIQLGATVDYAILMTTRYREEIRNGLDKFEAARITVRESAASIVTSGLTFFGATFGVAVVSDLELITSLCLLISRGAIISMAVILFVLPALLIASEGIIAKTTLKWRKGKSKENPVLES